jgi:hypothetical protein
VRAMKKWLQKSLTVAVALLTFGIISPGHEIWTLLHDKSESKQADVPANDHEYHIGFADPETDQEIYEQFVSEEENLIASAKDVSYLKFGSKIGPAINDEFDEVIFPKIEEVIQMTLHHSGDLHKRRLSITERPSGNYSEKIFNVIDMENGKDLILFHVRTEKRPQDGYYFNFHYHTAEDGFIAHHSIGDIYWSKNTPPKWLT